MSVRQIDDYLADVEEPKRSTLEEMRRRILEVVPDAEQTISYGCPAFKVNGKTVAGLAAFTHHLSFLPHSGSVLAALQDETRGYSQTRSALHFPVDEALPRPLIRKLLETRVREARVPRSGRAADPSVGRGVSAARDPRVDDYIAGLPDWQQAICRDVREIAHAADDQVEETIKRRVQPYFVLEGNVCALLAARDHVNVFIYDPIAPDPYGIINQGHGNATARGVQIRRDDALDRDALLALLRAVIANNRAGGWRTIKDRHSPVASSRSSTRRVDVRRG